MTSRNNNGPKARTLEPFTCQTRTSSRPSNSAFTLPIFQAFHKFAALAPWNVGRCAFGLTERPGILLDLVWHHWATGQRRALTTRAHARRLRPSEFGGLSLTDAFLWKAGGQRTYNGENEAPAEDRGNRGRPSGARTMQRIGHRRKQRLLKVAERRLGLSGQGLAIVAKAAADALHLPEVFTRPERYEVLGRYVGPDIAPAPSVVRARKLATRRQQAAANLAAYVATIEPKPAKPLPPYAATDAFLSSYEWRRLRMLVLTERGARCECCGATARDGVRIHVDHIKPRRKFPELALEQLNLQVLCEVCNHGKGNWDQTDWRDLPTHKGVQ